MPEVMGEVLPLAFVIALSPIPIVATVLMLLSPGAGRSGVTFLLGWVLGTLAAVVVFTALSTVLPFESGGGYLVGTGLLIGIGLILITIGVSRWTRRGLAKGDPPPRWMSGIDTITTPRAFIVGLVLAVNPKNALVALAAGLTIGGSGITIAEEVVVVAIFVLVATATVTIPVIAYLLTARRSAQALAALRVWLDDNTATVKSLQALIIGVVIVGIGIGRLG